MNNAFREWAESNTTPIDPVREESARCCEETGKMERGERGPLRNPVANPLTAEFSDEAFGVAAEVAYHVSRALIATGKRFRPELVWTTAATMLRAGWQRGQQIVAQEMVKA